MSNTRVTFQITLDLRAVVLLSVVLLLLGLIIAPTVAGAFPRSDDPEPQAYDATNAHKVDNHHAGPSGGTLNQRKNRVLWANNRGQLHWKAMPKTAFNNRYLNDDRKETISAAVNDYLLGIYNPGTGELSRGLYAYAKQIGVYGQATATDGIGVYGYAGGNNPEMVGVYGESTKGRGVFARSSTGVPLHVGGGLGVQHLIEGWDLYYADLRFKVELDGDVYIDGSYYDTGADFAEMMATSQGVTYEPGDLLVIGPDGKPLPSSAPNATNLLGVYSTDPAFVGGVGEDGDTRGKIPVAIMGIVPLKVSAENGAILPGDLLTSSSIPGHAMKASPVVVNGITFHIPGTILGKALEPLEEGTGVILVLVTLQ
jgi:hypothetical protein